ncbi:HdeD family acid-resistance protein [Arthrobacter sp. R-11]|uniref:HdeD family acid-resistance protein n=1 Tax=Arthrobacter sp. R-11 TaxID=3404053 RepID=UPI003CEA97FE
MSAIAARKLFKHSGTGLIFRGALALLLALAVASLPVATVFALAYVFGIYAMADGLANLAHYYYDPARHSRWSMLGGIASVAVGLVAVSWPGIVVAALALLVGIWGLALGISQIFIALEGRTTIRAWRSPALTGIVLTVFGILVLANPGIGILALSGLLAAFTAVAGLLLVISGFSMRRVAASARS